MFAQTSYKQQKYIDAHMVHVYFNLIMHNEILFITDYT